MAENLSGKGKRVVNKTELFRRGPSYFFGSAKRLWEEILEKKHFFEFKPKLDNLFTLFFPKK